MKRNKPIFLIKHILLLFTLLFISSCSYSEKKKEKKIVIPKEITMLFVTQPSCPSCDKLEATMHLKKPKKIIEDYFKVKKHYLGERFPEGLLPLPNGTPTVYFLGTATEVLIEPMIGEKNESQLLEYLTDALYEFNITYGISLEEIKKQKDNNETNLSIFPPTDTNTSTNSLSKQKQ